MKAHIHAHFIKEKKEDNPAPNFPFICLTVSGGYTQTKGRRTLKNGVIGTTIDDAVGEAFDKAGKIMGLDIL